MPKGGRREGAGRPVGAVNKATASLKDAAQVYTEQALATLASIMLSDSEGGAARVAAANALLDRGYGKPKQSVEASGPDGGPIQTEATIDTSGLTREQLQAVASIAVKPG